jgi:hypothetical protein
MSTLSYPMLHHHPIAAAELETECTVFCGACGDRYRLTMPGLVGVGVFHCDCGQKITFPYGVAGAE